MDQTDPSTDAARSGNPLTLTERHKLMRDGLINNLSFLVSGIVGIVLVPLMLKWLGPESYGIWIVAIATTALLSTADFGLYPTVVREVSSSLHGNANGETYLFVEGVGNAYFLVGVFGAIFLGVFGYAFGGGLHLAPGLQVVAHLVFWLIGASFCFEQLNSFACNILIGLRRFTYTNLIKSGASVIRALGVILLLASGGSLISIALWQVFVAIASFVVSFAVVRRLMPELRFRVAHLHWNKLRQKAEFAFSSLLVRLFGGLTWQSGSLLIGVMQGSASVVPFYIGEKFPYAASNCGWQAAEALFPAAGENQYDLSRTREILRIGTRWVLVLLLPVVALLWITGPTLLVVWIGKQDPESLRVLRLLCGAALADAFMSASLSVLWGRGAVRQMVATMLGAGLGTVLLTALLLPEMGVAGAAWGALIAITGGAFVLFWLACRECQASVTEMARSVSRGLFLPIVGCAAIAVPTAAWSSNVYWSLIVSCLAGLIVYTLLLCLTPEPNEERRFLQSAFRWVLSLL